MIDPELPENACSEVKEKVDFWHSRLQGQLSRFNSMADFWRLLKPSRNGNLDGFANPQVTETTRATEAIATFLYRAMTSAQPNFQLLSTNPNIAQTDLWASEQVINWQISATNYRRKLLKTCRSLALFGTTIVEEPWTVNAPYYEATDFMPRSLLQVAFDPLCFDIGLSPWKAPIDFVTGDQLRYMAKMMPDVWDIEAIEECLESSKDVKNLSPELIARLSSAGYNNYGGNGGNTSQIYQLITYYGCFKDDPTKTEYTVCTVNDLKTVRGHKSPYKRQPFVVGHLNEFEMEPYSYGVGRIAEQLQPELNSNRGRMHDTITFSLFNMWLASRMANVKTTQLRVRPWGVVEVDGDPETALKAIRPQLEGVNYGIQMENLMKTEFRATTGASDNLQAIVTEATATESSIAQTEAVRRLSVIAEIVSEPLLREHISKMHENNMTFLDQPFSIAVTGKPALRVYPNDLIRDVDVHTKIVTDKDFRPQRNKDLLQFLQVVTSIRNQNPQMGQINLEPFVEEFARGVGMDPKNVWSAIPALPGLTQPGNSPQVAMPDAMQQLRESVGKAVGGGVRSNAGELGAAAHQESLAGVA